MAEILRTKDNGDQYIEMTQQDWDQTHQDFKSDPGKPKRALMLVAGGTCSFRVRVVADQQLYRRLKVHKYGGNCGRYEAGTIAKIKLQNDTEVALTTADDVTITAKLDEVEEIKLTGLSLSLCVRDILRGEVAEEDVKVIYCGFDNWEGRPVDYYYQSYFKDWPKEQVDELLDRLDIRPAFSEHRNVSQGHWLVGEATDKRLAAINDRMHTDAVVELLRRIKA